MRFVSYRGPGGVGAVGTIADGRVFPLPNACASMLDVLAADAASLAEFVSQARATRPGAPFAEVELLPVVPRPGKVVCLGLNYAEHAKEGGFQVPEYPVLFLRVSTSLVGAGAPIVRPQCSVTLDYEAELAIIIGRGGRHISAADALAHVGGYTLFNDASVREFQRRTAQWTPGKNFDHTGALGPELVTPDQLPPGAKGLRIQSRLNGTVLQDANTDDMIFDVARIIAIVSQVMTLETGDVIPTGTPSGVGHARKPPLWMKHGDVCEVEIEGIGILRNPVRDEVVPHAAVA
jgi:2-keto-4-pentenoate hydratase/2-oxohepta-3-ene-1,7-dioic acid hydratase in catechol pathway